MILIQNKKLFREKIYLLENDLELEVINYSKQIFGEKTVYINTKKKIGGKSLGNTIPDGFLFDFSDKDSPAFYLVEVELAKHDFYRHIFPQITKFISFFKNSTSQSDLVEKIHEFIIADEISKAQFLQFSGNHELFKSIKDIVEDSQNILIVIDEEKNELKEIMDVYSDTWGKMVKTIIFKRFQSDLETVFSVSPEFNDIEYSPLEYAVTTPTTTTGPVDQINEEFHFEKVKQAVKEIYHAIKQSLIHWDDGVQFNPQKYYISVLYNHNVAYFITRKSKLRLVVKENIEKVKEVISSYEVNPLSPGVQKFWGGDSCEILMENSNGIDQVIDILKRLLDEDKNE
jgi:predicted transport protein